MKLTINLIFALLVSVTLLSCEDFIDINDNPNATNSPPIDGLLSSVTYYTATNSSSLAGTSSYWVQYLAGVNQGSPTDTYEYIDMSSTWNAIYLNLSDNYELMKLANETGATYHEAVAKIIEAYHLMYISDYWNGGPYTEAFDGQTSQPVWETGEQLYEFASQNLDEAENLLSQTPTRQINEDSDLIYYGDMEKWLKTIYALRARMALHTGDLNAIPQLLSNAYTSNDDDMQMNSFQNRNPWAQTAINNESLILGGFLSDQFISAMNGTTYDVFDPRLPYITDTTAFGDYRGTVNGEGRVGDGVSDEESYLETSGFYSSESAPLLIITYAELKFIEAEALLNSDTEAAYNSYIEGITANMNKIGVPNNEQSAYLNDSGVAVGANNLTLADIMREKYKALFLNPETWNDARRFDYQYEDFALPSNATLSSYIQIAPTPETELTNNRANAVENDLLTPVWWDQ